MITLTPQLKNTFAKVLARCNDCQPMVDFLRELGLDMTEKQDRLDLQRKQAETALQLAGVTSLSGK